MTKTTTLLLIVGLALGGCAPKKDIAHAAGNDGAAAAAAAAAAAKEKDGVGFFPGAGKLVESDAVPDTQFLIQLVTYKITVPLGAASRSDEFWRHVDERAVDVPTYETLYKNGLRVGVAPTAEWDYFRTILEQNPAVTQPSAYTGREAKHIDMELKEKVDYQNIFYLNPSGDLIGQTYERCDNLLRVGFQPAPRKPGTVRVTMVPLVKALREVWVPTGATSGLAHQSIRPERLFDLNLTADVPLDSFMVVALSPEGRWPSSLGNVFLVSDGIAEQTETLLIFRPMVFRQKTMPGTTVGQK